MARAKPVHGLRADTRFADAAADAIEVRAGELFEHSEGVLDMTEIERVHDMRVATRRLRAALEVFAPCFPKKEHKRVLREVKELADALGARRDPDVAIEALEDVARQLTKADAPGIESLVAQLRSEQRLGNGRLAEALDHAREVELEQSLAALVSAARAGSAPSEPQT